MNDDQVYFFRPGEERRLIPRMQFGLHRNGSCGAIFTYPIPGFPWRNNVIKTGSWQIKPSLAQVIFKEIENLLLSQPDICLTNDKLYADHTEKANAITRDRDTDTLCYTIGIIQSGGHFRIYYSVREKEEGLQQSTLFRTIKDLTVSLEECKPWKHSEQCVGQVSPEATPIASSYKPSP